MGKIKMSQTRAKQRSDPMAGNKPEGRRRQALGDQLLTDEATRDLRTQPRRKNRDDYKENQMNDEDGLVNGSNNILDKQMSKKLLESVEQQQKEEELEDEELLKKHDLVTGAKEENENFGQINSSFSVLDNFDQDVDEDGYIDIECSPEEEAAMEMFMPGNNMGNNMGNISQNSETNELNLAALISSAIKDKTQKVLAANEAHEANMEEHTQELSPKVIEVYTKIGVWLKHYKAGDLPKPFKIIPSLVNWEEVLCLTNPLDWSPNAVREATKIFASQLNVKMAQRFYNLVLLSAVRQDMQRNKKLNFHYYEALKKAMFKPAAFMKGILLPIAQESCTLREAHIITSILGKISVPVLHASATLIKLAEMSPWYGTNSIFMASLINKKYALPHSVIDLLVDHFYSFVEDERELPLVWHRCLLIFIQRYKNDFSNDQREKLEKHLIKVHFHSGIGPECRRELQSVIPKDMFRNKDSTSTMDCN